MIAPRPLGVAEGGRVRIGNDRAALVIHVKPFIAGVQRGVVVCESIWPNRAFEEGIGINALVSAEPPRPAEWRRRVPRHGGLAAARAGRGRGVGARGGAGAGMIDLSQ